MWPFSIGADDTLSESLSILFLALESKVVYRIGVITTLSLHSFRGEFSPLSILSPRIKPCTLVFLVIAPFDSNSLMYFQICLSQHYLATIP